ncbi:MAG: hypothetical protein Q9169_005645 [Polycauliona sp. 2 TL-2023]
MVQFYDSIPNHLAEWPSHETQLTNPPSILQALTQPVFFTASAPLNGSHINVSPKGLPSATFTIFTPNSAAYIDATGSGSETVSHVYENGRVTIMFCSFEISPRIMRFFCWGEVVEYSDKRRFGECVKEMGKGELVTGARAVVRLRVWKRMLINGAGAQQVQTSCGFGVPYLPSPSYEDVKAIENGEKKYLGLADRKTMGHWASKQVDAGTLKEYQQKNNAFSLDGLPGFRAAIRDSGRSVWWAKVSAWVRGIGAQREGLVMGVLVGWVMMLLAQILMK